MENTKEILRILEECASACMECARGCLDEDEVKMLVKCIKLDLDCADICSTTARLIQRGSQVSQQQVGICADICNACGEECEKHAEKMEHCRICAELCRQCEKACNRYRPVLV